MRGAVSILRFDEVTKRKTSRVIFSASCSESSVSFRNELYIRVGSNFFFFTIPDSLSVSCLDNNY